MKETRLLRQRAQHPDFSLEPYTYSIGSTTPHFIRLANTGQAANDIHIDCSWGNSQKLSLFLFSLTTGSRGHLAGLPINHIVDDRHQLTVKISCKDASANPYKTELSLDFAQFKENNRQLAFQSDPLQGVAEELKDIRRALEDLKSAIRR